MLYEGHSESLKSYERVDLEMFRLFEMSIMMNQFSPNEFHRVNLKVKIKNLHIEA